MKVLRVAPKSRDQLVKTLEEHVGKRTFWLHDQIGGNGWRVEAYSSYYKVSIFDDKLATFIGLLIEHETVH